MDHDDDVEHLFSWLQTPELRYREFAGAREITDTVVTWRARAEAEAAAAGNDSAVAEAPETTVAAETSVASVSEPRAAPSPSVQVAAVPAPPSLRPASLAREPTPMVPTVPPSPSPASYSPGARGRAGSWRPQYEEPVAQPMAPPADIPTTAERQSAPPAPPPTATSPSAPTRGGGLLGGAYREGGLNGDGTRSASAAPASESQQRRGERSLDAVFGRLAGGRKPPSDPRERIRHLQGLNIPSDRSR